MGAQSTEGQSGRGGGQTKHSARDVRQLPYKLVTSPWLGKGRPCWPLAAGTFFLDDFTKQYKAPLSPSPLCESRPAGQWRPPPALHSTPPLPGASPTSPGWSRALVAGTTSRSTADKSHHSVASLPCSVPECQAHGCPASTSLPENTDNCILGRCLMETGHPGGAAAPCCRPSGLRFANLQSQGQELGPLLCPPPGSRR